MNREKEFEDLVKRIRENSQNDFWHQNSCDAIITLCERIKALRMNIEILEENARLEL